MKLFIGISFCVFVFSRAVFASDVERIWNFDDPAASEKAFRVAMQKSRDAGEQAELLTQIARAQGLQAHANLGQATLDSLKPRLGELPPEVSVRYLLERGRLFSTTDSAQSERWLRHGVQLAAHNHMDTHVIDGMHMLALLQPDAGGLEWNFKALKLAQSSQDPRAQQWIPTLCDSIGWQYYDQRNQDKALDFLRQALSWHEAHPESGGLQTARWSLGKILRLTGQHQPALLMQLDVARINEREKHPDGFVFEEIAENLIELGRQVEAREYYAKAWQLLHRDRWLSRNDPGRLARLKAMAEIPVSALAAAEKG